MEGEPESRMSRWALEGLGAMEDGGTDCVGIVGWWNELYGRWAWLGNGALAELGAGVLEISSVSY
ncbi:MAG TPA: hypothetical protein PKD90_18585 [Phnomibacter sp.]|nr:hypothetical protein [Phnomibacter sp.]